MRALARIHFRQEKESGMLKFVFTVCFIAGALVAAPLASAQSYPGQSVKIIVGFPPGGTTDVIGRLVAQGLSESLGKSFLVDNRGGASGTIGAGMVAKSEPDGHTLLVVSSTHGTAPALYANLPYQEKDLVPIALVASTPYVFVVHPDIRVETFPQLLALLKQNPGKYNFASSSPGTAQHLGGELVKRAAGVDMVHVPYKGSGALMPDLLSGRVQMMFENVAIMIPHIKKGSLRPLAVSSAKRTLLMPEVPTVAESGVPGFEATAWFTIAAPAKVPADIVRKLNADMNAFFKAPEMQARWIEMGLVPMGGSPADAEKFFVSEREKWNKVIKSAGIRGD
jgi:tripartite-type tricarboxylate transporter receptor subunit TctC